jgi:hypothetical protein
MDPKFRKPVRKTFIGGALFGLILGCAVSQGFISLLGIKYGATGLGSFSTWAAILIIPVCTFGTANILARREYHEQLESARLHSHFCKRCGYDLRGLTDIVCPECGTGIPDKQRRHIQNVPEEKPAR